MASFDQALRGTPENAEAWNNRSAALLCLGRPEEALASVENALVIMPDYAAALTNSGSALLALKQPEAALARYDKALLYKPGDPETLANRGFARLDMRRHEEAARDFERLLTIQPNFDYARGWLVRAKLDCCDWSNYGESIESIVSEVSSGNKRVIPPFHSLFLFQACPACCSTAPGSIASTDTPPPKRADARGGEALITADHGNVEMMHDPGNRTGAHGAYAQSRPVPLRGRPAKMESGGAAGHRADPARDDGPPAAGRDDGPIPDSSLVPERRLRRSGSRGARELVEPRRSPSSVEPQLRSGVLGAVGAAGRSADAGWPGSGNGSCHRKPVMFIRFPGLTTGFRLW